MTNMENDSRYRAAALGALLARHYPAASPNSIGCVVFEMQRATRTAKKFAEDACNYDLGDPDDKRSSYSRRRRAQDKAQAAISARLFNIWLKPAALHMTEAAGEQHVAAAHVGLGGDPRGPCGRLIIPGQRGDGWGEGFAIY